MTRKLFAFLGMALVALTMSCSQAPKSAETHDADVQALKDIEAQWNKDYEAKDLDKIVGHYTDDAVLMAPGAPPTAGKVAIQTMLKQMVGDPALISNSKRRGSRSRAAGTWPTRRAPTP